MPEHRAPRRDPVGTVAPRVVQDYHRPGRGGNNAETCDGSLETLEQNLDAADHRRALVQLSQTERALELHREIAHLEELHRMLLKQKRGLELERISLNQTIQARQRLHHPKPATRLRAAPESASTRDVGPVASGTTAHAMGRAEMAMKETVVTSKIAVETVRPKQLDLATDRNRLSTAYSGGSTAVYFAESDGEEFDTDEAEEEEDGEEEDDDDELLESVLRFSQSRP